MIDTTAGLTRRRASTMELPDREPDSVRSEPPDVVRNSSRSTALLYMTRDITSMANADGYVVLPVNLDVIDEGEEVTVTLLE